MQEYIRGNGEYYILQLSVSELISRSPPNTALGMYASLVPIVVICSLAEDADAINQLNVSIFSVTRPTDAYRLNQLVQWEDGPVSKIKLKTARPYYAIHYGIETGIYIGFHWYVSSRCHLEY